MTDEGKVGRLKIIEAAFNPQVIYSFLGSLTLTVKHICWAYYVNHHSTCLHSTFFDNLPYKRNSATIFCNVIAIHKTKI